MDDLITELVTRAGPLVILAGLFLLWDYYRGRFAAQRWAQRDREFTDVVSRVAEATRSNADSLREFGERLLQRPCLWEESQQRLLKSFDQIIERISEAVVVRVNGKDGETRDTR